MPPLRRKRGITLRNDNQERYSSFTPGFYGFETPAPATPKRRFGFGALTACAVLFLILGLIGGAVLMRLTSLDHYYGQYAEAAGDQEEGDLPAGTPQPEGPEDRPAVTVQPDPLPEREELPVPALGSDTLPNIGEENRARDIADQVGPSVVSVTAGWVYESQVTGKEIREDVSAGSGIVLTADGYIVTNEHIIAGCDYYCATVGGVDYDAVLLGSDAQADIAVLKIEAEGLTPLPLAILRWCAPVTMLRPSAIRWARFRAPSPRASSAGWTARSISTAGSIPICRPTQRSTPVPAAVRWSTRRARSSAFATANRLSLLTMSTATPFTPKAWATPSPSTMPWRW